MACLMSGIRPCFIISFTRLHCSCLRFSAQPIAARGGSFLLAFFFSAEVYTNGVDESSLAWPDHTPRRPLFSCRLGVAYHRAAIIEAPLLHGQIGCSVGRC